MSWEEKKMYVVSLVEKAEVAQRKTGGPSRRGFSFRYQKQHLSSGMQKHVF